MLDPNQILSAISSTIAIAREVSGFLGIDGNHEQREKVVELRQKLLEINEAMQDVLEENQSLKAQVKRLSSPPEVVKGERGLLYKADGEGPFCPHCYVGKQGLYPVVMAPGPSGLMRCGTCKEFFR